MSKEYLIELNKEEWELIRDATADIMCWHRGFSAAKPDYEPPPQLKALGDLIGDIKSKIAKTHY